MHVASPFTQRYVALCTPKPDAAFAFILSATVETPCAYSVSAWCPQAMTQCTAALVKHALITDTGLLDDPPGHKQQLDCQSNTDSPVTPSSEAIGTVELAQQYVETPLYPPLPLLNEKKLSLATQNAEWP